MNLNQIARQIDISDNYERIKLIGEGSNGKVVLVCNKADPSQLFAVKIINLCFNKKSDVMKELYIHSSLNHPNIVKVYGYQESAEEIQILMEYAELGNLYQCIKQGKFSHSELMSMFR